MFGAEELDWHDIAAKVRDTLASRCGTSRSTSAFAGLTTAGASAHLIQHLSNGTGLPTDFPANNLAEVIEETKPTTVEDYVAATRAEFDTDGRLCITDARLHAA